MILNSPTKLLDQARTMGRALLRSALLLMTLFGIAWYHSDSLMQLILPSASPDLKFVVSDVLDRVWIPMKLSLFVAVLLSLPYLIMEIYFFLAPALQAHELRALRAMAFAGPLLFFTGVFLWLGFLLPQSLKFLIEMGPVVGENLFDLSSFLGFALGTSLVIGALFQLPIALRLALNLGLISRDALSKQRRAIYVGLALLAAVLTPSPDAFTLMMLWVPMIVLFEATIFSLPTKAAIIGRL